VRRLILTEGEQRAVDEVAGNVEFLHVLGLLADALLADLRPAVRGEGCDAGLTARVVSVTETLNWFLAMFVGGRGLGGEIR